MLKIAVKFDYSQLKISHLMVHKTRRRTQLLSRFFSYITGKHYRGAHTIFRVTKASFKEGMV